MADLFPFFSLLEGGRSSYPFSLVLPIAILAGGTRTTR